MIFVNSTLYTQGNLLSLINAVNSIIFTQPLVFYDNKALGSLMESNIKQYSIKIMINEI